MPKKLSGQRLLFALGAFLGITFAAHGASTDISSIPMAVKNNVAPNFMFMVDSSGSMTNVVPEAPYNPATTYLLATQCTAPGGLTAYNTAADASAGGSTFDLVIRRRDSNGAKEPLIDDSQTGYKQFGTTSGKFCFNPTKYYNARLIADSNAFDCDSGGINYNCREPGSGYLDAVYSGNYLNWYYGTPGTPGTADPNFTWNGTGGDRKPGVKTRLEIAKSASNATLDSLYSGYGTKIRVGLSTYDGSDGGELLQSIGNLDATKLTNTKASVNGLTSSGSTPLSETLADIGRYFTTPLATTRNLTLYPGTPSATTSPISSIFTMGNLTGASTPSGCAASPATSPGPSPSTPNCPIQYWCQRSYAILVTDGRPQNDQGLSTSSVCNYAKAVPDCSNSGRKTSTTHSGHLGGVHSYESGGSDYLDDMAQALYDIDLRPDLIPPAGRTKKNNIRTYTIGFADDQAKNDPLLQEAAAQGGGEFDTADDTASLQAAITRAVNDALGKDAAAAAVAVVNTQITIDNTAYASSYDPAQWTGDLEAFGLDTSTAIPIEPRIWSAKSLLEARTPVSRFIATMGTSSGIPFQPTISGLSDNLVNFVRGDRTLEGSTFRKRGALLGDIVNAEPVVQKYSDGKRIVFQAANDGMLHVFDGTPTSAGGQELWAYVPKLVYGKLPGYASPSFVHSYLLDATPTVADIGSLKLLVGGLAGGGAGYYALDISSYAAADESVAASKVKWEALGSDNRQGLSYGSPLIVNTSAGWRVVVTSGYNNNVSGGDGIGRVFVLNPADGTIVATISTATGTTATPSGLAHLSKSINAAPTDVVRYVYGGDLLGNVWRFDLTSLSATKIAALTDAAGNYQPVSTPPAVRNLGNVFTVSVGTGLYLGDSDIPGTGQNAWATQRQTMYGILDDTSVTTPALPTIRGTLTTCPGDGDFICQTTGTQTSSSYTFSDYPLTSGKRGWYVDLPSDLANSRIVTAPQVTLGGALAFTANIPTNTICDPGGSSWFFVIDSLNGGAIETTYGGNSYWPTGISLGNALASRPVIVEGTDGKRAVIRMSDRTFRSPTVPEPPPQVIQQGWRRIYWRELQ